MIKNYLEHHLITGKNRLPMADVPNDFPKWELVYYNYIKWANAEDFDLLLSKLRERVRIKRNQKREASLV